MTIAFSVIAVIAGSFALYTARQLSRQRAQTRAWPRVPGRITARQAVFQVPQQSRHPKDNYAPEVRYAYAVDGVEYEGDRLNLSVTTVSSRRSAERALAKIPDAPDVLYDPADPKVCCLTPPGQTDVAIFAAAGVGAIVLGVVLVVA